MSRPVRSCRRRSYPQSPPDEPKKITKKREFADISNTKNTKHNNDIRSYFNPIQTENILTNTSPPVFKKPKIMKYNPNQVNQISNEIMVSQVSISQQERIDGVAMMRKIKKVLESDFKNVHERLQLDPIPMCLYNLKHCIKNHSVIRNNSLEDQYLAKQMLIGNQFFQFISFIRNMCGRNEQPDSSILLGILELIMRVGEDENCLPFNQTLIELESVFLSIFHTFPPCHLRKYYLKMFKSQFNIGGVLNSSDSEEGILSVVLNLLNDNIYCDTENDLTATPKNKIDDDTLNNFYLWEKEHEDVSTFNSFDRSNRFHRIFVVLDLLLRVLESDLSIFMIKYSSRLSSSLSSETRSPLIVSVVWQNFDEIHINNSTIKLIINIYVNMVALNYPSDKIQIISRLINLLATVLNIREYPDETFEYPIYKQLTMNIVREIKKTLENSVYFNHHVFVKVIEHLRNPLLKMLLSNELLLHFETCSSSISLQNVYSLFRNSSFLSYKESKNCKEIVNTMKYPVYDRKYKIKSHSISQKDYLKLLKLYTESTIIYYRINDGVKELHISNAVENVPKNTIIPIQNTYNFDNISEGIEKIDYNEEFIPRRVELNFKKLIHIKFNKDACLFYREQIKNLLLLKKVIKQCSKEYGPKFDDWMVFVQKLEEN